MRRFLLSLAALAASLLLEAPARADSWMFHPSYYTHHPVHRVQVGRHSAGGPVYTSPQGAYVRGGWRYRNSGINLPGYGWGWDSAYMYESWVQTGEQW